MSSLVESSINAGLGFNILIRRFNDSEQNVKVPVRTILMCSKSFNVNIFKNVPEIGSYKEIPENIINLFPGILVLSVSRLSQGHIEKDDSDCLR